MQESIAIAESHPAASEAPVAPAFSAWKDKAVRIALFAWTILIACPIRYWPIGDAVDITWAFALNYGVAHGLRIGKDMIWTTGPLGYLVFPQDIGNNLIQGLVFQSMLWMALIAVLADLFFRARLATKNLAFFSIFFSLSAPLYWFDLMGLENLMLAAALILLVLYRERGGSLRYVSALAFIGAVPLIKLTGGMVGAGALAGFLVERAIRNRQRVVGETVLALVIPSTVALTGCWLFLSSFDASLQYLRESLEIAKGYSSAMSLSGDPLEFAAVAEVFLGIAAFLFVRNPEKRSTAWFLTLLLAAPLVVSVKHGFVRQDFHVINFFCFAALALGLIATVLPLDGQRSLVAVLVLLNFGLISTEYLFARLGPNEAFPAMAGIRGVRMAVGALHLTATKAYLHAISEAGISPDARLEPELRALVGNQPVAFLSVAYGAAAADQLNLQIYPMVQRYAAYTPALDQRNAAWVRDRGPRFLIFDGHSIDSRHFWAETPAMWLEVYRWYDTRLLGLRNLLLERRTAPRFTGLTQVAHATASPAAGFDLPEINQAPFWKMSCPENIGGSLRKLVLRTPEVDMQLADGHGETWKFRALPEVLDAPLPGRNLPVTLTDLAVLLDPAAASRSSIRRISFSGPGLSSYAAACAVEFLAPSP